MIHLTNNRCAFHLAAFAESSCDFYLTGSRFFGDSSNNSDWDFFVSKSQIDPKFLQELGLRSTTAASYTDSNSCELWEVKGLNCLLIQVQIVRDVALKLRAQALLNDPFIQEKMKYVPSNLTKNEQARPWWEWAYKAAAKCTT